MFLTSRTLAVKNMSDKEISRMSKARKMPKFLISKCYTFNDLRIHGFTHSTNFGCRNLSGWMPKFLLSKFYTFNELRIRGFIHSKKFGFQISTNVRCRNFCFRNVTFNELRIRGFIHSKNFGCPIFCFQEAGFTETKKCRRQNSLKHLNASDRIH